MHCSGMPKRTWHTAPPLIDHMRYREIELLVKESRRAYVSGVVARWWLYEPIEIVYYGITERACVRWRRL